MPLTDADNEKLDRIMRDIPGHRAPAPAPALPQRPDPRNVGEHDPLEPWPYGQLGGANPDPKREDDPS